MTVANSSRSLYISKLSEKHDCHNRVMHDQQRAAQLANGRRNGDTAIYCFALGI